MQGWDDVSYLHDNIKKYRFLQPSKQLQLKLTVTNYDIKEFTGYKISFQVSIRPFYCQITSDNK